MNFFQRGARNLLLGKDENKPEPKKEKRVAPKGRSQSRYKVAQQNEQAVDRFIGGSRSVDANLRNELVKVREASRNAGDDIGFVKRYFSMVQTHVVGETGLRLQANVKTAAGKLDREVNKILENEFAEWAELGSAEIGGRMSWVGAQELTVKTVAQDGDMLQRYHYDKSNRYGFSIELIEADLLDVTLNQTLRNGNRIVMGVEVDKFNRRVAFHMLTAHPGDDTWVVGGRRYQRIPAAEIDLLYPTWRPGQNRGVPWAHASLLEMYQINGMRESQLVSARIAAGNMAFYERDPELEVDDDEFDEEGELLQELDSGQMSVVPEGYKVNQTNFQTPQNSDFQKDALRGSASGMDVNYNVIGNDYEGVSFSSLRQAILEDRDAWKRKQRWLIEQQGTPVYKRWLRTALLKDALPGLRASDLSRLSKHKMHGRRWQWVDPLKDEQAAGEAMGNLTTSPMHVLRDKGLDAQDVMDGWAEFGEIAEPIMQFYKMLNPDKAGASEQPAKPEKPTSDEQE